MVSRTLRAHSIERLDSRRSLPSNEFVGGGNDDMVCGDEMVCGDDEGGYATD